MLFAPDIHYHEFQRLFEAFVGIAGPTPWINRYNWVRKQCTRNALLKEYCVEHHSLEIQFERMRGYQSRAGHVPTEIKNSAQYQFFAFVTQFMRVHERLSQKGQNRLRGMLSDGLQDPGKKAY